jgi:tetratricopeptide (TPR) repeat protein
MKVPNRTKIISGFLSTWMIGGSMSAGCNQNNQTFVIDGNNCFKLRFNYKDRKPLCHKEEVRNECPQSCGLCCANDPNYVFNTDDAVPRNCEWLGRNENSEFLSYCDEHKNGRMVKDACPESCNFCMPSVETVTTPPPAESPPTVSPSPTMDLLGTCVENHDFQITHDGADYSCKSIRNKEDIRLALCPTPDVRVACPISCGLCCADDESYMFETPLKNQRGCEWINNKLETTKKKLCLKHRLDRFIYDACAKTCHSCMPYIDEKEEDRSGGDTIAGITKPQPPPRDTGEFPIGLSVTFSFVFLLMILSFFAHFCRKDEELQQDDDVEIIAAENGETKMIIHSSSLSTEASNGPEYSFPKLGVKVSYFDDFLDNCGGSKNLTGLTTAQVCESHIKTMTIEKKLSLCELLRDQKHPAVGKASIFISHVWQCEFLNVVNALRHHLRTTPDAVVWFDLFSINQHKVEERPYEWWSTTFMSSIKEMGHTVMVINPWNNHLIHSRSWCLFEAYCTRVGKCKFEIALNESDRDQLIKDMEDNPNIEAMIGEINFEKSLSYREDDRKMILKVIKDTIGYHTANEIVFDLMRRWIIDMAKAELENNSEDEGRIWKLLHMLGMQFQGQGKLELSKQLLEKCLQQQKDTLGPTHPHTLSTLHNLADLYCKLDRYDKAKKALEDVYLRRKATLGRSHQDTIGALHNLAAVHLVQRDYDEAKRIYEEVLQIRRSTLGSSHPLTLNTLSNLALLYKDNGDFEHAKKLYEEVLQLRKNVLGESHPKTLSTLHNLASLYSSLGKHYEAKIMFENCLFQQRSALGESHPDTLGTMNNLAVLYHKDKEFDKAADMYEECLRHQKTTLGELHPDTQGTLHNLALLYETRDE